MKNIIHLILLLLLASCSGRQLPVILLTNKATVMEKLAAKELRRYLYLRTGSLTEINILEANEIPHGRYILVTSQTNKSFQTQTLLTTITDSVKSLKTDDFYLYSTAKGLVIAGGSDNSELQGVYHLIQDRLNVGFYLSGDVIPDGKSINIDISGYNKVFRSLKEVRNNFTTFADNYWVHPQEFSDSGAIEDYYKHWCFIQFGNSIANEAYVIFSAINDKKPEWYGGTGDIKLIQNSWELESKKYTFVDQFEDLLLPVKGKGNLNRYQYWLNKFKYQRTIAQLGCSLYLLNQTMERVNAEIDQSNKKNITISEVFPLRSEITRLWGEASTYWLESISTKEEMDALMNFENHNLPLFLKYDSLMVAIAGPLPSSAILSKEYRGKLRVFVTAARTLRNPGEELNLKVVILGWHDITQSQLYWKPLGGAGDYKIYPLKHISRGVYEAMLPAKEIGNIDIEYFINIIGKGESATFPVTAPEINQTVVARE